MLACTQLKFGLLAFTREFYFYFLLNSLISGPLGHYKSSIRWIRRPIAMLWGLRAGAPSSGWYTFPLTGGFA